MTIGADFKYAPVTLTGTTGTISIAAKVDAASEIAVYRLRSGTQTLLTYSSDWTITGLGSNDGATISITGQQANDICVAVRQMPRTQTKQYTYGGDFPATTAQSIADREMMHLQEVAEIADRSLKLQETATASQRSSTSISLPTSGTRVVSLSASGLGTIDPDELAVGTVYAGQKTTAELNTLISNGGGASGYFYQDTTVGAVARVIGSGVSAKLRYDDLTFTNTTGGDSAKTKLDAWLARIASKVVSGQSVNGGLFIYDGAELIPMRTIPVRLFGAKGDGEADDGPPIQEATDWWKAENGRSIDFGYGDYLIETPVNCIFSGSDAQKPGPIVCSGGRIISGISAVAGTGTITITSNTITGVGTALNTELEQGDSIVVNGTDYIVDRAATDATTG